MHVEPDVNKETTSKETVSFRLYSFTVYSEHLLHCSVPTLQNFEHGLVRGLCRISPGNLDIVDMQKNLQN